MLIWTLSILRQLPVRHRLGLVIGIILVPAAVITVLLLRAADRADHVLGKSIERTVDDLMPVARLEANLEQARFELERSITTADDDIHQRLSKQIDSDFNGMLARHNLPANVAANLKNAFTAWQRVSPIVDRALGSSSPSPLPNPEVASSEEGLAQTVATIDSLRAQLLQSIKQKYLQERRIEHLYDRTLLFLWIAGLFAAAVAVYLLSTSILRPLNDISHAAKSLKNGDFAVKLSVSGRDEFTAVAATINAMAETIQETHAILYDFSLRDALTGALNRRGLEEALTQSFIKGEVFSIMVIDVDHFKEINDQFGHAAGDEALKELARCMVATTRGADIISRYGGDEFVIVLPGADSIAAEQLAERIFARLNRANKDRASPVRISVGIAQKASYHRNPQMLIEAADRALYEAKSGGRGTIRSAAPSKA